MQPTLMNVRAERDEISSFGGYWARGDAREGMFVDLLNTSARRAPALSPRLPRGISDLCINLNGMYAHGEMCWVDGTGLYYDSAYVGEVADSEKTFVSMGAYLLIFPDKLMLNTADKTLTPLNNRVAVSGVAVSACDLAGAPLSGGACARLACEGIGAGFRAGDVVEITGGGRAALNGFFYLHAVESDALVITCPIGENYTDDAEITVARETPDMDYVFQLNNRIWGCSSTAHEVYACRLGDATNWRDYRGLATDAYAATVASAGDFTGCCAFAGFAMFFKEDEIIKLYGAKPANFELISSRMPGVERGSARSLAVVEGTLYYKGPDGVYAYDGAYPSLVSAALGETRYENARAGALGGRYYVSMEDAANGEWKLFVYDEATSLWHREHAPKIRFFAGLYGDLFFADADGLMQSVNGTLYWYDVSRLPSSRVFAAEEFMDWYAETGDILLTLPDKKTVTRLQLRMRIGEGAAVKVYVQYEPGSWSLKRMYEAGVSRTETLPLRPHRSETMRILLSGYGDCAIESIIKTYQRGSER